MSKGSAYNYYKDLPPWAKGVSVLIILGLGAVTYFAVKKWLKNKPPKVKYPSGGLGIPKGFDARPLANKLHDVMKGLFTLSGNKDAVFLELLNIPTDDMFVAVYDTFNQLYMSEGDGTLKEWINDEYWTDFTDTRQKLNERFNKLNLK